MPFFCAILFFLLHERSCYEFLMTSVRVIHKPVVVTILALMPASPARNRPFLRQHRSYCHRTLTTCTQPNSATRFLVRCTQMLDHSLYFQAITPLYSFNVIHLLVEKICVGGKLKQMLTYFLAISLHSHRQFFLPINKNPWFDGQAVLHNHLN